MMVHWYWTPELLHFLFADSSNFCWYCSAQVGILCHLFWTYPELTPFWKQVTNILSLVLNGEVELDRLTHLLALHLKGFSKTCNIFASHILTACRCLISSSWRSTRVPSIADVYLQIRYIRSNISRPDYLTDLTNLGRYGPNGIVLWVDYKIFYRGILQFCYFFFSLAL